MNRYVKQLLLFFVLVVAGVTHSAAQTEEEFSSALDSARAKEDNKKDSVVFTAKYVRYTTLAMMKQATRTVQIDTSHVNFQYYNKQNLPWNPSINLGSYGLATRDLLFNPNKKIGFQPGFYALERYLLHPDSVQYFRARARYSELYTVGFFFDDQVFRARLAQNITPQWNIGVEYHATNTDGYYRNQDYSDRKAAVFSWYESKDKRYNLLVNGTFNNLDAPENGSVVDERIVGGDVFQDTSGTANMGYLTRLSGINANRPYSRWRDNGMFLRQSYFLGRLDTVNKGLPEMEIHPTNAVAHNSSIRQRKFIFFKNEPDLYGAFPLGDIERVDDTTNITTISNEFIYSFYLRGKGVFKNEAKLDLAFQNDLIWYSDSLTSSFYQNSMLKGNLGYKFSDRIDVRALVNQIVVGAQAGDFLYEANADIMLSENAGKISLGAYSQNKSPEMVFNRMNYTFHQWENNFNKTKTQNLSFAYQNKKIGFSGKAEYFLMDNYLYFREVDNPGNDEALLRRITPAQSGNLNLLKVSVWQNFRLGRFHLDNMVVYQKTDAEAILATPEFYTWHSFYYTNKLYNVMDFRLGMDVRFNTPFRSPSYAINAGQFYNDNVGINYSTYPIGDVWFTGNIDRVNLFLSYNFFNQFAYPKGYYTVRRYPMNDANFRFGVSWKFYD
ncbi:putative porin [Sphingobacterium paludis]|uniref:Putative beta-barrel porin n=1 Tax=Sphingobacterium paludis TaxID=1476465 RepID=A0A4R7CUU5_9SPHI|nr:putative porin [Sphingobacterium paludis]TDS08404.1 putative beta-barrel porin [Sphingobacterium paludis]